MYTFKAQNDTELSFSKGERLEVIDRPPSDPDWFKARNTSAQIGLVPKNYLVELSQYLTQDVGKNYLIYRDSLFISKYNILSFRQTFIMIFISGVNGAAKTTNGNGAHTDMGSSNVQGQAVSQQTLDAIKQQPWYFGHITRADCDNILTDKGLDGDFLVRESETNVSQSHQNSITYRAFEIRR